MFRWPRSRAAPGSAWRPSTATSRTVRELLEALYIDEVDAVCNAAATIDGDTPGAAFMAWLRRFFIYFTSKRHVAAELLEHSDRDNPVFGAGRPRVLAAGRPLLIAAQDAHEVRGDLTLEQILDMVVAIAKIPETPATSSRSSTRRSTAFGRPAPDRRRLHYELAKGLTEVALLGCLSVGAGRRAYVGSPHCPSPWSRER